MSSIKVHNGEKHERGVWWYVVFAVIVVVLIVFSLVYGNYSGVLLLFFLVGGYLFYQVLHLQELEMVVQNDGVYVDKVFYAWSSLQGFVIEVNKQSGLAQNIVLVQQSGHSIYTFVDTMERVKEVVMEIDDQIPLLDKYQQTFAQRVMRMLKL